MRRFRKFDKKIDNILSKMTLKEKIGQLNQGMIPLTDEDKEVMKEKIRNGEVGTIILASGWQAERDTQ